MSLTDTASMPEEAPPTRAARTSTGQVAPALLVHEQFRAHAYRTPERVAGWYHDATISYGALERRSNQLAHFLRARGVEPGIPVGVCVDPSLDVLVALLAVLKAGGIYLPLHPTHPEALVRSMLDEARPPLVLTRTRVRDATAGAPQLCLDECDAALAPYPDTAPDVNVGPDTPATMFYTSGTTGKPKAVRATHANLTHYVGVARDHYGFGPNDVFGSLARYTFSISLFELLSPLCAGGAVRLVERERVLDPRALTALLETITVVHAGPSLLTALFRFLREGDGAPRRFPNVRHASSGGDIVPPSVMEGMKQVFDRAELFVIYGCTEISCMGCSYPLSRDHTEQASFVGKPFPGVALRVVGPDLRDVAPHDVGEILIAGPGVVPGYHTRAELSKERFRSLDGKVFYRTGDVGRLHDGGNLEMLGRRDYQVQVRGMRVELVGIERTVIDLGLAAQCVVVAPKVDAADVRLVAFVVQPSCDARALKRTLATHLPDYMVPQQVVALPALPLTANGKVDRASLLEQAARPLAAVARSPAPTSPRECQIAAVFAEALQLAPEAVGVDDDFFDLGGHSLLAVTVMLQLERVLGMALPAGTLFQCGSVRALAAYTEGHAAHDPRPVNLSRRRSGPRLFMVAGVHVYRELARRLEDTFQVFAVFTGCELTLLSSANQSPRVEDLARDYLTLIRREQPHGPYYLGGTSFGGILVYEVAQQLARAGEQVAFVGMIDAMLPENGILGWVARARRLAPLPLRELVPLVHDRMRVKLLRALRRRRAAEFAKYQDDERFSAMEILRADAQRVSADAYMQTIATLDVPVALIISGTRISANPHKARDCGWQPYARRLSIHEVEADHLALLEEPSVAEVAAIFARALPATTPRAAHAHPPEPDASTVS